MFPRTGEEKEEDKDLEEMFESRAGFVYVEGCWIPSAGCRLIKNEGSGFIDIEIPIENVVEDPGA